MDPATALGVTAQIAVAIAGFAGVVTAFRGRSVHQWGPVERLWLRLLLMNSILPLAFSLVGLFVVSVAPAAPTLWRWCSALAALTLLPYAANIIRTLAGFEPGQLEAAGGTRLVSNTLFILLLAMLLLQLLNVAMLASFWPFYGAIVALLFGAMYQFVRLVLFPQPPGQQ
jgi:hypothetical protein